MSKTYRGEERDAFKRNKKNYIKFRKLRQTKRRIVEDELSDEDNKKYNLHRLKQEE